MPTPPPPPTPGNLSSPPCVALRTVQATLSRDVGSAALLRLLALGGAAVILSALWMAKGMGQAKARQSVALMSIAGSQGCVLGSMCGAQQSEVWCSAMLKAVI